jgi:hypothetical protein
LYSTPHNQNRGKKFAVAVSVRSGVGKGIR